jgi:DNA modification methylase
MNPVVIGNARLYLGDCLAILPTLPKVDAVITSPPYAEQREYGGNLRLWDLNMRGAFFDLPVSDDCQILVNLGLVHREGECVPYWEAWREWMRSIGWRFFAWYVWDQGDGLPGDWSGRLAPSHEFIFHFNRKARRPNKWAPTKSAGRKITGTSMRRADGTAAAMLHDGAPVNSLKIADSVLRVYREMRREVDHPAIFPERLPTELCESFTTADHIVLDPFMGSGTTGVACMNLGRKFIGIEIEPKYFDIACERIDNAQRQSRLFRVDCAEQQQERLFA